MYNKLFSKILDSSIWLEPTPTRIVWLTCIAAMDEDGFAQFASVANLAHRAIVSEQEATDALAVLEAPDRNSSDPDNDGRRLERVPGGWMVLNAAKYREIVTREESKRLVRERVKRHRVTRCNAAPLHVTGRNDLVTQSDTDTDTDTEAETDKGICASAERFACFWTAYPRKVNKGKALKAFNALHVTDSLLADMLLALGWQVASASWIEDGGKFIPHPASWLNGRRWEDERPKAARPRTVGPDYAHAHDWQEECQRLHGGRCGSATFHAAAMQPDEAAS